MGESTLPRINEVTAFLASYAPEETLALAKDQPRLGPLLKVGVEGGAEPAQDERRLREGVTARAEILAVAIAQAVERSPMTIVDISRRLALARRVRFTGTSLATIGASSVIGTALLAPAATLAAGILTLASNLATLFANTVVLGSAERDVELIAVARRLQKCTATAEMLGRTLEALRRVDYDLEEMKALLQEANVLFSELNDALASAAH